MSKPIDWEGFYIKSPGEDSWSAPGPEEIRAALRSRRDDLIEFLSSTNCEQTMPPGYLATDEILRILGAGE